MKIMPLILLPFLFYSCIVTSPAEPPTERECIDYWGTIENWQLTDSTFKADLEINFSGSFSGTFIQTDSGKVLTGTLTGTLVPDLGERKGLFTKTGTILMRGIFTEKDGEYEVDLHAIEGTEGFKDTPGDLYLNWIFGDFIYYGGTFCMLPNPE